MENLSYIKNDMKLNEAFGLILSIEYFPDYIRKIAEQIYKENSFDDIKINIKNIIKKYEINSINEIKEELIDLILIYIRIILNDNLLTDNELYNVSILKNIFNIEEGEIYKFRHEEISEILDYQLKVIYRNDNRIDETEALYKSSLQKLFDLGYDQFLEFANKEDREAIKRGAKILDLDTYIKTSKALKENFNKKRWINLKRNTGMYEKDKIIKYEQEEYKYKNNDGNTVFFINIDLFDNDVNNILKHWFFTKKYKRNLLKKYFIKIFGKVIIDVDFELKKINIEEVKQYEDYWRNKKGNKFYEEHKDELRSVIEKSLKGTNLRVKLTLNQDFNVSSMSKHLEKYIKGYRNLQCISEEIRTYNHANDYHSMIDDLIQEAYYKNILKDEDKFEEFEDIMDKFIEASGKDVFKRILQNKLMVWYNQDKVLQSKYSSSINFINDFEDTFGQYFNDWKMEYSKTSITFAEDQMERSISQEVKNLVWKRDGGKCVTCGSNINLEYDHIIPFSKGGSNTYRNIQLLCEACNRKKSANIE